ncbi:hypothetical protein BT69DRAFT_1321227 [Atractiella rhizophila]|nr:hypothetical protein BT69DRAFT_1321227 [Atractiella rhizophila]
MSASLITLTPHDLLDRLQYANLSREHMAEIRRIREDYEEMNQGYERLRVMGDEMREILQNVESGVLSAIAEMKAYNENRRACTEPINNDEIPKRIQAKKNKEGVIEVWLEAESGVWTSILPKCNEEFATTAEKPIPSPQVFEIVREPLLLKFFNTPRGRNMWLPSTLERLRQKYNEAEDCFYYIFWNGTEVYFTKYTYGQVLWHHPKSGTSGAVEFDDLPRFSGYNSRAGRNEALLPYAKPSDDIPDRRQKGKKPRPLKYRILRAIRELGPMSAADHIELMIEDDKYIYGDDNALLSTTTTRSSSSS